MLIHHRPRAAAGRIAFPFERLPVAIGACSGTVTGTAFIGFDGHGAWWLDQLALSNPRSPGPETFEPVISPLFAEVRERLDQYRREDVGEAIEAELARGGHMRTHDEHRPHALHRRSAPPHARPSARDAGRLLSGAIRDAARPGRAAGVLARLAAAGIEIGCLGVFLTGVLCWSLPDPVPHGLRGRPAPSVLSRLAATEMAS